MSQDTTSNETESNFLAHAKSIAAICRLYGQLWLTEVDLDLLSSLSKEPLASHFADVGGMLPTEIDKATVDDLAIDYCQLLVGPKDFVSPVQSVWVESQFNGKSFADVQKFYGLLPEYETPSELKDHIGVQLDFLGSLLASIDASSEDAAKQEVASAASAFFRLHLRWAAPMLKRIEAQAQTDFYRGLAVATRRVLQMIETELVTA